jgi:N-acetylglutamate synthase-like GNAT family acetyltransferase
MKKVDTVGRKNESNSITLVSLKRKYALRSMSLFCDDDEQRCNNNDTNSHNKIDDNKYNNSQTNKKYDIIGNITSQMKMVRTNSNSFSLSDLVEVGDAFTDYDDAIFIHKSISATLDEYFSLDTTTLCLKGVFSYCLSQKESMAKNLYYTKELAHLAVDNQWNRNGIGSNMVKSILMNALQDTSSTVYLTVLSHFHRVKRFYLKNGFCFSPQQSLGKQTSKMRFHSKRGHTEEIGSNDITELSVTRMVLNSQRILFRAI